MKRFACLFMIFLTIVNFLGCSNNISSPSSNIKKNNISFLYLNDKYEIVDNKTDKLYMIIENVNLKFISEKEEENKYRAIIIDEKNKISVDMLYLNGSEFPRHVSFNKGDDAILGTFTQPSDESVGIFWAYNGEEETFRKVELPKDIYKYDNISSLDSKENYQAKTLMVSLRVWQAINNYLQDSKNQPKTRFFFIFTILLSISIITTAIVATAAVALTIGFTVVAIKSAGAKKNPVSNITPSSKEADTYPKKPIFYILYNGKKIKDNSVFTIDYDAINISKNKLELNIVYVANNGSNIENNVEVFASLDGSYGNPYSLINAYYNFSFDNESVCLDDKTGKVSDLGFSKSNYMKLNIDKKNKTPNDFDNVVLRFMFTNEVDIFEGANSQFVFQVN